jgi:hypothetical protein
MLGTRGIVCASQYGAASTWMFNLVARLVELGREAVPRRLYVDELDAEAAREMAAAGYFVAKSHVPGPILRGVIELVELPMVVTVRDPRDSVVSLMQRFGFEFRRALGDVRASADALSALTIDDRKLLLRYEDGLTRQPAQIAAVAAWLGIPISKRQQGRLAKELSQASVRARILAWQESGGPKEGPEENPWEPETHWHENHVGDGQIGKWAEILTPGQEAEVLQATRRYREVFGYREADPAPLEMPLDLTFNEGAAALRYLGEGFSAPEAWGIWTDSDEATLRLPFASLSPRGRRISLDFVTGSALRHSRSPTVGEVSLDGEIIAEIRPGTGRTERIQVVANLLPGVGGSMDIRLRFTELRSPAELGEGPDQRRLGLGLIRLRVEERG